MAAPPIDGVAVKNFEGEDSEVTGGKRFGEELTGQKSVKLFDHNWGADRTQRRQRPLRRKKKSLVADLAILRYKKVYESLGPFKSFAARRLGGAGLYRFGQADGGKRDG